MQHGYRDGIKLLLLLAASLGVSACGSDVDMEGSEMTTTESGLMITTTQAGSGAEAAAGNSVSVHYTGWLYDPENEDGRGTKFDSSVDRGQPFEFVLVRARDGGLGRGRRRHAGRREARADHPLRPGYGSRARGVNRRTRRCCFEVELLAVE